ncbi:MAG: acyl carrier protein [Proteobacteria bacterium]|nr:acyl carrier protein [Pseudomonadota bacterium]
MLEVTPEEEQLQEKIRTIWSGILSGQTIDEHTDFFKSGAGSMDVTRLLEEVREVAGVEMENDDVYMNSTFSEFVKQLVLTSRGGQDTELEYDAVSLCYNIITIKFYCHCVKKFLSSTTNPMPKGL